MRLLLFHLVVVLHHLFCTLFHSLTVDFNTVTDETILNMSKVQKSFLTGWNFALQTTYCVVALAEDIVRLKLIKHPQFVDKLFQNKTIRMIKHRVFTSIVFPVTCFVTTIFWTFFNYDRELIYPAVVDKVLPMWYNHSLHTSILVVAILEMWLVFHPYPKRKWGLLVTTVYVACYCCCLFLTYAVYGIWVYPMYGIMSWPQRLGLMVAFLLFFWLFHELGQRLNSVIWGDKMSKEVKGRSRKKPS